MTELLLFVSTYIAVFSLGLQSLNVNQGHYWAAAGTSILISSGHVLLYRYMPEAAAVQVLAYYAGGITGITSSMWVHARTLGRKRLATLEAQERRIAHAVLDRLQDQRIDQVALLLQHEERIAGAVTARILALANQHRTDIH